VKPRWAIIWTAWLLLLIATFGLLEGLALAHGGTTLSAYVWTISKNWPPLPFIAGFVAGFLCCHFWWTNQGLK
jgi:hypothetical protein